MESDRHYGPDTVIALVYFHFATVACFYSFDHATHLITEHFSIVYSELLTAL